MADLSALEILNPNRKAGTQADTTPVNPTPPQEGNNAPSGAPAGQLDPAMVQALINGIQALRKIGMSDTEIVDTIMQAISIKGLQITEDQIRQIVESVPQSGQAPTEAGGQTPPTGGETPPQGTPNITPGG